VPVSRYVPLSKRERPDHEWDTPREGIPDYLAAPIYAWLDAAAVDPGWSGTPARYQWLLRLQTALGVALNWEQGAVSAYIALREGMQRDHGFGLDVLDFALHDLGDLRYRGDMPESRMAAELGVALDSGRSAWQVVLGGDGHARLQRRLIGPVDESIDDVRSVRERAHYFLAEAREKLFRVDPDATDGWHDAVRAVEVVAIPVVLPDDPKATLGKIIKAIEDKPSKWKYELGDVGGVLTMLSSVWALSPFRHGSPDETVPLEASLEQATAAFHLALALVQIFATGLFTRATGR
jgi:hypothetical protein